jgi:hypothetical protein
MVSVYGGRQGKSRRKGEKSLCACGGKKNVKKPMGLARY